MSAQINQIVKAYEELSIGVEDIAAEHDISPFEVKTVLLQFSKKYQKDIDNSHGGTDVQEDGFTDEEHRMALQTIVQATCSEDEGLRFRAAKYIRQDKKGRLDLAKGVKAINLNVIQFNEHLKRMYESTERTIKGIEEKSAKEAIQIKETVEV